MSPKTVLDRWLSRGEVLVEGGLFRLLPGMRINDLAELAARSPVAAPLLRRIWAEEILEPFRRRGVVFVHIPRNGGTSIVRTLYGRGITHFTAAFYRALAPDFFAATPSFAILRDPVDRFLSAYSFLRARGGEVARLYPGWARVYGDTIDDFDHFLERHARVRDSSRRLDYVFRSQADFVLDDAGRPVVRHLFALDHRPERLAEFLADFGVHELPRINRTVRAPVRPTERQIERIRAFHAADVTLHERVVASL